MGTNQASEAMIIKKLNGVIAHLTQNLNYKTKELEMLCNQVNIFLQEIENKEREIAVLKGELQNKTLNLRKVCFIE